MNQQHRWLIGGVSFEKGARGKYMRQDEEEIKRKKRKKEGGV